jgi:DNA-binding IclR family transcriptional regulator
MPSPLAMPARQRSPWDDVDHALLTALRTPGLPRDIAAESGLPEALVAGQLDVYVRDGLAVRTGFGDLRYKLTLRGYQRMFGAAPSSSPGHQAAA